MQTEILALIIKTVFALSSEQGLNVAVAIYDESCHLSGFSRMPESYIGAIRSAQEKGRSSCHFQRDTKEFEDAVNGGKASLLSASELVAISGGVAIRKDGKFLGAIGISGGTSAEDHVLGKEVLKKVYFNKK